MAEVKPQLEVVLPEAYTEQLYNQMLSVANAAAKQATENIFLNNRYLQQKDLMKYLGIGMETLNEMVEDGLQYIRLGKRKLYDLKDVDAYLQKKKF